MSEEILKNIQGLDHTCLQRLSSGATGTAFKVCRENTNCVDCLIAKVGHKPGDLDELEAAFDKSANTAVKGTEYEPLVSKFAGFSVTPEGIQILSSFYNANFGDMKDFMSSRWATISVPQFASLLIEIFATLDFLFQKIGFVHMDLKLDNVLIIPGTNNRELNLGDGLKATLPDNMNYSAMVIDYGNGYSSKDSAREFKGAVLDNSTAYDVTTEFQGACYYPGFDVFRFFYTVTQNEYRMSQPLLRFWQEARKKVFSGFYDQLAKRTLPRYGMLSGDGCYFLTTLMQSGSMFVDYEWAAWYIANTPGSGCEIETLKLHISPASSKGSKGSKASKEDLEAAELLNALRPSRQSSNQSSKSPTTRQINKLIASRLNMNLSAGRKKSHRRSEKKRVNSVKNASMSRYRKSR